MFTKISSFANIVLAAIPCLAIAIAGVFESAHVA
jgi:hypothetical protein